MSDRRPPPSGSWGQRLSPTVKVPGPVSAPPPPPPPPSGFATDQQATDYNTALARFRAAQRRSQADIAGPPEAVIEICGRWWHLVYIRHGMLRSGPDGHGWHVFGRRRAERLAARKLAAYLREQQRYAIIIRPGGPSGR